MKRGLLCCVLVMGLLINHNAFAQVTQKAKVPKVGCLNYYDSALCLKIYKLVDTPVEYPGGVSALLKWINKSISLKGYSPLDDPNDGTVKMNVYFDADGGVLDTRVPDERRNKYSVLERKVSDLLKKSKWTPAMCEEKNVAYVYPFFMRFEFF